MTLAFKHDYERQECACLPSVNSCSALSMLPVHIHNLETMKKNLKIAITTTQKYGFGIN